MFRKPINIKECTLLKTSEKKKFRTLVASSFFDHRSAATDEGHPDDNDGGMQSDLHSSLVKGDLAVTKAVTDNGNTQFQFYTLDKTPVFFLRDEKLHPTVYLLWSFPSSLPRIYTHAEVFEKLKNGADLMLPGVITRAIPVDGTSFKFPSGALCAVCLVGNDAAVAVGQALMSGEQMLTSPVRQGKAVHLLHLYQDNLWRLGPMTRVPSINLAHPVAEGGSESSAASTARADALSEELEASNITEGEASAAASANNETTADASLDNDVLFLLYFLYAVQKRLRNDSDLPVLASTFYGGTLLPLMPSKEDKVTIQRTSYKKFNVFLSHMQEDGLVAIQEPKKGVESIVRVDRSHELFKRYSHELKSLPTSDRQEEQAEKPPSKVDERPVNIRELRAVTAAVLPLFEVVNKSIKKGQALGAADVRSVITSYVKSRDLASGRMVKLDALLAKCCTRSTADQKNVGDTVTWETLMESVFGKMTPCVEIEYADKAKEVKKGKQPTIRIKVARRAGNKKVTMVDNVQAFGIDPKTLAQDLQVILAVSSTLNESPGCVGPQVQVQGEQADALAKIFMEKYNINKKYLQARWEVARGRIWTWLMALPLPFRAGGSISWDKLSLIRSSIHDLRDVAEYLLAHGVFNDAYMRGFLQESTEHDQLVYLIDHIQRRGPHAYNVFIDSLIATQQFELAKAVQPGRNIDENEIAVRGANPSPLLSLL